MSISVRVSWKVPSRISLAPTLETGGPAKEALIDRLGTGGQAALEDGQGEPDGVLALAVEEPLGAVHAVPDVCRDLLIQLLLQVGQLVRDGLGNAFGEERGCRRR
jgi:hypothetical protein